MKKMTFDEWKAHEEVQRKEYKEMGVTDLNEVRTRKMWGDPAVKDEDIPCENFTWDKELKTFVHTGSSNTEKH